MILKEPGKSTTNTQVLACKELNNIQARNMPQVLLTILQTPNTKACFRPPAIRIMLAELTDKSDKNQDAIVRAPAIVTEQCNIIKKILSLFPKTI